VAGRAVLAVLVRQVILDVRDLLVSEPVNLPDELVHVVHNRFQRLHVELTGPTGSGSNGSFIPVQSPSASARRRWWSRRDDEDAVAAALDVLDGERYLAERTESGRVVVE